MNLEPHHRRIHRKVRTIHFGLLPLTLLALPAWIYAYAVCQDAETAGALSACRLMRAAPYAPVLLGAIVLGFVVRDLARVGHEALVEAGGRAGRAKLHHAVHGYRTIAHHHRRHIHWAVIQLLAVALGIALWIAYKSRQSTF